MCDPITLIGGISSIMQGIGAMQGASNTKDAGDQAAKNAQRQTKLAQDQATQQEQELNRKNAKTANAGNIDAGADMAGQQGESGTMLTGPTGVDPALLKLGKNTLLGA